MTKIKKANRAGFSCKKIRIAKAGRLKRYIGSECNIIVVTPRNKSEFIDVKHIESDVYEE